MSNMEPKASGPRQKGLQWVIMAIIAVFCITIGFFLFGVIGLTVGGFAIMIGGLVWVMVWGNKNMRKKPMLDIEHAAQMDLIEDTMMANLATPVPLKVTTSHNNSTAWSHPGDVFGRTILPADADLFKLLGAEEKLEDGKPNRVWAYRMRMFHKGMNPFSKKDQYIAIICQSQIDPDCLDATGDISFNHSILAHGHWAKYGCFYVLFDGSRTLATAQAATDTVKAVIALKESQNRMAEAVESNARTHPETINAREAQKDILDVVRGD